MNSDMKDKNDMKTPGIIGQLLVMLKQFPVTLTLIIISLICFPAALGVQSGEPSYVLSKMTFLGIQELAGQFYFQSLAETMSAGEYWRLLTPMFIHFNVLHLVFNLLWVWEIGRRIEIVNGRLLLILLVLAASLTSNLTEFSMTGPALFGGMSGVVFGLLGYSYVFSRLVPQRSLGVLPGIYIFMLIYLVIGFTGVIDLLGIGSIANWAHLGGLVAGLIVGAVMGIAARFGNFSRG